MVSAEGKGVDLCLEVQGEEATSSEFVGIQRIVVEA